MLVCLLSLLLDLIESISIFIRETKAAATGRWPEVEARIGDNKRKNNLPQIIANKIKS